MPQFLDLFRREIAGAVALQHQEQARGLLQLLHRA